MVAKAIGNLISRLSSFHDFLRRQLSSVVVVFQKRKILPNPNANNNNNSNSSSSSSNNKAWPLLWMIAALVVRSWCAAVSSALLIASSIQQCLVLVVLVWFSSATLISLFARNCARQCWCAEAGGFFGCFCFCRRCVR